MSELHKELLAEVIGNWTDKQMDEYILELNIRAIQLHDWIKHVKTLRRKKTHKRPEDTGTRGGL